MAELNINNLVLDDNTFDVLPDGDYHFSVESHELDYYSGSSTRIPPNTQQVICHLTIPYEKDGDVKTTTIRNTLNIYRKALFAVRQFVECIGMVPEKGQLAVDLDKIDGLEGVCSISTGTSAKGNEFNNVGIFYPPSKVPAVTANDEAWKKWKAGDGFTNVMDDPFMNMPEG